MDFNKVTLKNLIKIVRLNKMNNEITNTLGLKDIRFAKKKPLVEFMTNNVSLFPILEEQNDNDNVSIDNNSYESSHEEPREEQRLEIGQEILEEEPIDDFIQLNLDNIKNRKKMKPKPVQIIRETPEQIEQKNNAIIKINRLTSHYKWLNDEHIDYSEPIKALKIIEAKVSARNTTNFVHENFFTLCGGLESLVVNTPSLHKYAKIEGFTQVLKSSEALDDVLDELIIKYSPAGSEAIPVEARFCLIILGALYKTHQVNTLSEKTKNITNKPVTRKFEL